MHQLGSNYPIKILTTLSFILYLLNNHPLMHLFYLGCFFGTPVANGDTIFKYYNLWTLTKEVYVVLVFILTLAL